jgi:hypothetical protein
MKVWRHAEASALPVPYSRMTLYYWLMKGK